MLEYTIIIFTHITSDRGRCAEGGEVPRQGHHQLSMTVAQQQVKIKHKGTHLKRIRGRALPEALLVGGPACSRSVLALHAGRAVGLWAGAQASCSSRNFRCLRRMRAD